MSFPRSIIYIGKENNNNYIYTLEGPKYLTDDVTEDGLVYMCDSNEWIHIFKSNKDLNIIKLNSILEELEEIMTMSTFVS